MDLASQKSLVKSVGLLGCVVVLLSALLGLGVGGADTSFSDVGRYLGSLIGLSDVPADPLPTIFSQLRFPRIVLGILVGGALASSGASYQGVFRNDLADPYLLGVSAGAGLGATLALALWSAGSNWIVVASAFVGGIATVVCVAAVARAAGGGRANLLLAGIALASVAGAIQTLVVSRNRDSADEVFFWILGGLVTSGWSEVLLMFFVGVVPLIGLVALSSGLDVLRIGDVEAQSLGLDTQRLSIWTIVAATLLTSTAVAVSGLIGFVGLVIPHLLRIVGVRSYRHLIALSAIWGAAFMSLADLVARGMLGNPIPVGIVTTGIGGPFFIGLLVTSKRSAGVT